MDRSAKDVDAIDPDLSRFAAHGGKLIIYHGWNDPAISPLNSVQYLGDVQRAMGSVKADNAVRLYMVPGMEHCAGGPGPNIIGQLGFAGAEGEGTGAMDLLRIWVERGKAPGPILAVKVAGTHEPPVRIVRPVCAYPQEAKYNGRGDPKTPESFACKTP
jgi:hypothetical protein